MKPDACLSGLLAPHFSKVPSSRKKFLALRRLIFSSLSKEAKKLRLRLLPCDSSFLEPQPEKKKVNLRSARRARAISTPALLEEKMA